MNTTLHLFGSRTISVFTTAMLLGIALFFTAPEANAQNPALVEGNCNNSPEISAALPNPGKCGDYDGDGRIGIAEDADGDLVFGTINAALNNVAGGTDGSGRASVTIIKSGIFRESITITGASGSVTLQAAPGVEAIIDGNPPDNVRDAERVAYLSQPGITINSGTPFRFFILRNLTVRHWGTGVFIEGASVVAVENCRIENNPRAFTIEGSARVAINKSEAYGGFSGDIPPNVRLAPGTLISFAEQSSGTVTNTSIGSTFSRGIVNTTNNRNAVCAYNISGFPGGVAGSTDVVPSAFPCGSVGGNGKGRTFFER